MVGNDTVLKGDQAAVSFPAIESGSGPPGFVLGAPQVPFGNASSLAVVVIASSLWFDTSNVEDQLSSISNMEVRLYRFVRLKRRLRNSHRRLEKSGCMELQMSADLAPRREALGIAAG